MKTDIQDQIIFLILYDTLLRNSNCIRLSDFLIPRQNIFDLISPSFRNLFFPHNKLFIQSA